MYLYDDYLSFCIYVLYLIILLTLNDNDNESNNNTNNTYIDNIIIVIFYLITLFLLCYCQLIEFLSTKTAFKILVRVKSEWEKRWMLAQIQNCYSKSNYTSSIAKNPFQSLHGTSSSSREKALTHWLITKFSSEPSSKIIK